MSNIVKNELIFFTILLIILAFIQHSDLLTNPSDRIELMTQRENYLHPFLWVALIYIVLLVVRLILKFILKLFKKR